MDDKVETGNIDVRLLELLVCPLTKGRWNMMQSAANWSRARHGSLIRCVAAFPLCCLPRRAA
ncbi:hypothetical protein B3286c2_0410 [Brucella vulpis]|nr:hypothetical protein BF3285c2_0415 [Brucella vulpis]CUW51429.1 hypothetical protein B3286c2_0410 [Brucella vulpis]